MRFDDFPGEVMVVVSKWVSRLLCVLVGNLLCPRSCRFQMVNK